MSISINPTIPSSNFQETNVSSHRERNRSLPQLSMSFIRRQIDTYSSVFDSAYFTPLKAGLDAIYDAFRAISKIENNNVKKQAVQVLTLIQDRLSNLSLYSDLQNRLPKILLSVLEEGSVLLEWNFENFRLGISLEDDEKESSYYIVSRDNNDDSFSAITDHFEIEDSNTVNTLVDYVIRNT